MSKTFFTVVNYDTPMFINAVSEASAISVLADNRHGATKVFGIAAKHMENLDQLVELYQTFYHETIDVFLEIDAIKGFYSPYISWIGDEKNA